MIQQLWRGHDIYVRAPLAAGVPVVTAGPAIERVDSLLNSKRESTGAAGRRIDGLCLDAGRPPRKIEKID